MIRLDGLAPLLEQARRLPTTAHEGQVLLRSGLVDLRRPDDAVYGLLATRGRGMVAGAIRIATHRDRRGTGLVDDLGELTFEQLDGRSNAVVRAWQQRGLDHTSVIALMCRDHRWLVDCVLAGGKLGARLLLLNTGFAGPQLTQVVEREGADVLVFDAEFSDLVDAVPSRVSRYLGWVDDATTPPHPTVEMLIDQTSAAGLPRPKTVGAVVLLTSGTTGSPKGAARQVNSPFAAAQFLDRIPFRPRERTLVCAPLFHATGLSQFLLALALGCTTILRRRFDPEATLRLLAEHDAQVLVVVPTMLQRILELADDTIASYDTGSLRIVFCAGSALPPEVGNRATALFGPVVYNVYGSTEVAVAAVATPADWRRAPGTVGRPPVGCAVRLYDDAGERVTADDTTGRVFVRSGLRFVGYTGGGRKDEIDGFLSSGDVGHFDHDGLLFIDGRDDDMIVSGGENVFPAEVENLLVQHPAVADAAVVGVPDAEFGERLAAFVVLHAGQHATEDELRTYVKSGLARHKVPRAIEFRDALPRNATGKLVRNDLC